MKEDFTARPLGGESTRGDQPMEYVFYSLGASIGVYVVSRLIFAAYFKSKQQYEDNRYGQKPQSRS